MVEVTPDADTGSLSWASDSGSLTIASTVTSPTSANLTWYAQGGSVMSLSVDRTDDIISLQITDNVVEKLPGTITVNVGNGNPFGTAYFFLDAVNTPFFQAALDDMGRASPVLLPMDSTLTAGVHTVGVNSTSTPPNSSLYVSFTVQEAADDNSGSGAGTAPPLPAEPNRWVFQAYDFSDINNVDTYILPINPTTLDREFGGVKYSSEPTVVSSGRVIAWEGAPQPTQWTFSGRLLDQASHEEMLRWGQTGQRFYMTDHNGERFLVKTASYSTKRIRDMDRKWHHSYDMVVWVLDGAGVIN